MGGGRGGRGREVVFGEFGGGGGGVNIFFGGRTWCPLRLCVSSVCIGKRGLMEKTSFQKGQFPKDSRDS